MMKKCRTCSSTTSTPWGADKVKGARTSVGPVSWRFSGPWDQESQRVDTAAGHIVRHDVLGGLIHEYERVAA